MNWKSVVMVMTAVTGLSGCVVDDQAQRRQLYLAEQEQIQQKQRVEAAEKVKYAREHKVAMTKELQVAFETAVKSSLKDPDSATFRHFGAFKDADGGLRECGEVNSKNSYGGYVGFTRFNSTVLENAPGKYFPIAAVFAREPQSVFDKYYPECAAPLG